eukprot:7607662-Lingulodinium_polyedra.AAC.1
MVTALSIPARARAPQRNIGPAASLRDVRESLRYGALELTLRCAARVNAKRTRHARNRVRRAHGARASH